MKTIIAGTRTFNDYLVLLQAIGRIDWEITQVISGTAKGVDRLGERWAKKHNVPVERYFADWTTHRKRAGIIRNVLMVKKAEALLALWDGKSRGTDHIITIAREKGLRVYVQMIGSKERRGVF